MTNQELMMMENLIDKAIEEGDIKRLSVLRAHLDTQISKVSLDNPELIKRKDILLTDIESFIFSISRVEQKSSLYRSVWNTLSISIPERKQFYVVDLVRLPEDKVKSPDKVGSRSIFELNRDLNGYGLSLGMDITDHDVDFLLASTDQIFPTK